jgi:hypothetical protein
VSTFTPVLRVVLGVLGAGAFGAGTAAVFLTDNGTGSAVLVALGGILIVLALLGDRIESLGFGGAQVTLRAVAGRLARAEESELRGDTEEAERLRVEAQMLLEAAGPIASDYDSVRSSMPSGPARTAAMEQVLARARQLALDRDLAPAEVAQWLREGTDEQRITALGLMQADPRLWDFDAVLAAIERSRSAFEQYHALRLAGQMLHRLDARQRQRLAVVVRGQRGWRFRRDTGRWGLSEDLLRRIGSES